MAFDRNRSSFTSENSEKGLRWFHLRLKDLGSCTKRSPGRVHPLQYVARTRSKQLTQAFQVRKRCLFMTFLETPRPQGAVPMFFFQKTLSGTSLVVQWLRLYASNAGSMGKIPSWGTKIPTCHAALHISPKTTTKKMCVCVCVCMYERKKTLSSQPFSPLKSQYLLSEEATACLLSKPLHAEVHVTLPHSL